MARRTQLEQMVAEADEARRRYLTLFQLAPVAYLSVCREGMIRQANLAGARLLNRSGTLLRDVCLSRFFIEADGPRFEQHLAAASDSGIPLELEVTLEADDGSLSPVMLLTSAVSALGDAPTEFRIVLVNIARQRKTERQLRRARDFLDRLAHHDPLTGLPNRMMFFDRLRHAMARCVGQNKLAVLFFDIDGFKPINDTLGHAAGDQLLCEIANRLRTVIRADDTIARLGGDEFTVILGNQSGVDAVMQLAARIADSIRRPIELDGQVVRVSSSIGVSIFPDQGTTADELVKGADLAMYRSKSAGRDQVSLYSSELGEGLARRAALETAFTDAVLRREFELVYQPIVAADSATPCHFEALVRWRHPQLGVVMPAEFIPVLERSGQIVELGRYVIDMACRQVARWQTFGCVSPVAVNVSARQLLDPDFSNSVCEALRHHGLSADLLELELTESQLMRDQEKCRRALIALQQHGIRITIDDFGTGHSSLSRLLALPVSRVKIDRALTHDVGSSRNAEAIVRATVSMAHHLDLDVVAEGVETEAQLNFLRESGADKLQGYLISRPLSADDANRLQIGDHELSFEMPSAKAIGDAAEVAA